MICKRATIPGLVLALHLFASEVLGETKTLCAGKASADNSRAEIDGWDGGSGKGAFIGLASDNVHKVKLGDDGVERWTMVKEGEEGASSVQGWTGQTGHIVNSFTGEFARVLPDDHDSFGGNNPGDKVKKWITWHSFPDLNDVDDLPMTTLSFSLHVGENGGGMHTLFLRWTGGDMSGGGDSLYVAMFDDAGKVVPGPDAVKPVEVPIADSEHDFSGCCYNMETHACPCYAYKEDVDCPPIWGGRDGFIPTSQATSFGTMCKVGHGVMDIVRGPRWYEFAGQEAGNVMDFDSEAWDATCEAEGQGTIDSGKDFASWHLEGGKYYTIAFFPREDGTAFDAFYLAGPSAVAPGSDTQLSAGASTVCSAATSNASDSTESKATEPTEPPSPESATAAEKGHKSSSTAMAIAVVFMLIAVVFLLRGAMFLFPGSHAYISDKLAPFRERLQQLGFNVGSASSNYSQMQPLDDFAGNLEYVPPQP